MKPRLAFCLVACVGTALHLGAAQPAFPAAQFSGLMGGDGQVHFVPLHDPPQYTGHAPVLAGCPQWGWGGAAYQLPIPASPPKTPYDSHWSNRRQAWMLPTADVGFYDLGTGPMDEVGVFLRSHAPDLPEPGFYGETNQNDGWFRFQVRIPAGNTNAELHFTLCLTNRIDGRTNYWFGFQQNWDWAGTNFDQTVFRPLTRVLDPAGPANLGWSWRNTISLDDPTGAAGARRPVRRFKIVGVPTALGRDVFLEVAQGLPYTLSDLEAFWGKLSHAILPAGLVLERTNFVWGAGPVFPWYTGYKTGLSTFPPGHVDAETNNSFFGILLRTNAPSPLAVPPLVLITAGTHYEPPGLLVCEGIVQRIVERGYWKNLTFVIVPVCNPDAFAWGVTVLRPFGTKYSAGPPPSWEADAKQENGMSWWRNDQDDVEAVVLREHLQSVRARFSEAPLVLHLDLHSDLCPHPDGWWATNAIYRSGPPVYGLLNAANAERWTNAMNFAARIDATPRLGPYMRSPQRWRVSDSHWPWPEADYGANVGANIYLTLEFDEACLYRDPAPNEATSPQPRPSWLIDPPAPFLRCAGSDCYWVDGPIPLPEYYRYFGQDIADAIATHFSPIQPPAIALAASDKIEVRWTEGVLQWTSRLEGEATQWTDAIAMTSPWTAALSSGQVMFFRTKRPND